MLIRALGLEQAKLIALVGAGGKTTLMFSLAREFVAAGERVLITTTTKIATEEARAFPSFTASSGEQVVSEARRLLPETGPGRAGAVIASSGADSGGSRLIGFAPEQIDELAQRACFDRILVEADGSARKPLKVPAAHEPVVPAMTDALIVVAGINGLGLPLAEETLFRAQLWSDMSGLALGAPVSAESLARTLSHPQGLTRNCPAAARSLLFLNQVDSPARHAQARRVAACLAQAGTDRIQRVAIARLLPQPEIVEIINMKYIAK